MGHHSLLRLFAGGILVLVMASVTATEETADRVSVSSGALEGTVSEIEPTVRLFRGVPFAAPPVGELRWKAPQPAADWEGVRPADQWANRCVQGPIFGDIVSREKEMSEDCLYLNVWAPAASEGKRLPVYLWFHGGGFAAGSAAEPRYDGAYLAKQGIVVVEPNYRLGIFGFLALPELTKESPHAASGNYGLLDQVAALRWVRKNVAAFGGDPENITIGGESAGSLSVSALMASPLSRGLVHKAVGESGAFFASPAGNMAEKPLAAAEKVGLEFAASVGAASLVELRAKPAEELLSATMKANPFLFGVIVDGHVLPETVRAIYAGRRQARIPLLAGWNSSELGMSVALNPNKPTPASFPATLREQFGDRAEAALAVYPAATEEQTLKSAAALASDQFISYSTWKWLEEQAASGVPVFRYRFDRVAPDPSGASRFGALHAVEIEYAFNTLDSKGADWQPEDRETALTMARYWANFIKTGDPNGPGLADWPALGEEGQVMCLDSVSQAGPEEHRDRYELLDSIAGR